MAEPEKVEKIDSVKLTKAAEDLQGCSIMDAFAGQSLQDQIAAIRHISVWCTITSLSVFRRQPGGS